MSMERMKWKGPGWAAALAAAFAGPAAHPAGAAATTAATAAFAPSWAEAQRPFTLALSGESQLCAPVFSHAEVRLSGGKLVLSVLMQQRLGVLCVNLPTFRYRAEFAAPALDTGNYPVQVRWREACEFDANPCPVAYDPQDLGTLQVTDSAHLEYHLGARSVVAGKAFTLPLKGGFRCGDKVTGLLADTARPALYLDFTMESGSGMCDTVVVPPAFAIPPLRAGIWQVYARRTAACPEGTLCPILVPAPRLAGALEVVESADALVPWRREPRAAPALRGPAFAAPWNGAFRDAAGRRANRIDPPRTDAGHTHGTLPSGAMP